MVTWKWHNFLCYFALWASAILNALTGIGFFSYANRSFLAVLFGILFIGLAVFEVYTALQLLKKTRKGVELLKIGYIISAVFSIVSLISAFNASNLANVVISFLMVYVNGVYYGKRDQYLS